MRLSKAPGGSGDWQWDTELPPLPGNATRITGTAHSIDERWLVIGLGNHAGTCPGCVPGTVAGALTPYRLDLHEGKSAQWEAIPAYPGHPGQELSVPISAVAGGKWLVFGGQYVFEENSEAMKAWADIPADLATAFVFGQRPTGGTIDVRDAYSYDPT